MGDYIVPLSRKVSLLIVFKDFFVGFFFILVVSQSETGIYRKAFVQQTRPNVGTMDKRSVSCSDAKFLNRRVYNGCMLQKG